MEAWKKIKKHPKYEVSNHGRIRNTIKNCDNQQENLILSGWIGNHGYRAVDLGNKKYLIHRLVAEAFIPNPKNKPQVNHKDLNKLNNCVNNLEWVTSRENNIHARILGVYDNAVTINKFKKPRAKIVNQYDLDRNYIRSYLGSKEAELVLKNAGIKINARNIRAVCAGKRKTAGGYIWAYEE